MTQQQRKKMLESGAGDRCGNDRDDTGAHAIGGLPISPDEQISPAGTGGIGIHLEEHLL